MTIIKFRNRPVFTGMFDEMAQRAFSTGFERSSGYIPASNILEKENEFLIELFVPGLQKMDFNLQLENRLLSVSCEKKENDSQKEESYLLREFEIGGFIRSFSVPETIEKEKISASYENGVLKIIVPKRTTGDTRVSRNIEIA
ncbi:MAG TPA: Hsp20/alpha crystallin family protein [Bacteroidales bacterium]|nr:Hsp20/alpha crystallin family protein [Bacteroidales bacterium]